MNFRDPNDPGNKIRPKVRCIGCGKKGCITAWGNWCFKCNVERIERIDRAFVSIINTANQEASGYPLY